MKNILLILVLLLLAGSATFFLLRPAPRGAEELDPGARGPVPTASKDPTTRLADPVAERRAENEERGAPELETTVAWPLTVDLELLTAAGQLQAEGESPLGSGANARLTGRITDTAGRGVAATIEFEAGANSGRRLVADAEGVFGAADLYPGLSIVRVTGVGILGSRREISLRQRKETLLNISYARPSSVQGRITDQRDQPLEGARVEMDGQVTSSDVEGRFYFPRMTSGPVLVLVEKQGMAALREVLNVTAGFNVPEGKIAFRMKPGARLEVIVADNLGAKGEAQLYFLPAQAQGLLRDFPWFRHNPTPVYPGGRVVLDDLPEERVQLWLFHAGAVASPAVTAAVLRAGATTTKTLHLQAAPLLHGVVRQEGKPVKDARVTLEAPDRVEAMLALFGQGAGFLEVCVLPFFPTAAQTARSDGEGKFTLGANEHVQDTRYIVAQSADGKSRATKIVRHGEREVVLELEPWSGGNSRLVLPLNERFQGLPIAIVQDEVPRERFVLAPRDRLVVDELRDGRWRLTVTWNGLRLFGPQEFELRGEAVFSVELPEDAIIGQTEEELQRAGLR